MKVELAKAGALAVLESVVVAVKQKNLLATSFHPELTSDLRWHELFMRRQALL